MVEGGFGAMLYATLTTPGTSRTIRRASCSRIRGKLLIQSARHLVGPLDRLPSGIRLRTCEPPAQQEPEQGTSPHFSPGFFCGGGKMQFLFVLSAWVAVS